jgi:hypothetical protein
MNHWFYTEARSSTYHLHGPWEPRIYAMLGIIISQESDSAADTIHYALQCCNTAHSAILNPVQAIKSSEEANHIESLARNNFFLTTCFWSLSHSHLSKAHLVPNTM